MRAVGYHHAGAADVLVDLDLPEPVPGPRDLLVEVRAVSVNPVDTKVRASSEPDGPDATVLGYDAAGVVRAVGSQVTLFAPGDRVWYAGTIDRPGSNSELQLVDERIVGPMPALLDFPAAAAMPLTTITAWELLFDRLGVPRGGGDGDTLLVLGASGGVGTVLVQLAATQTTLRVIGTASSEASAARVRELGAHDTIDYTHGIAAGMHDLGPVRYVASLTHTDEYFADLVEVLAPQGSLAITDDPPTLDAVPLKPKAISLHWEFMFVRAMYETPDIMAVHDLLADVAGLVDAGVVHSTLGTVAGEITAANLIEAHRTVESGRGGGKTVLAGWPPR